MRTTGFDKGRLERLRDVLNAHVERDSGPSGLTWAVAKGDEIHVGTAGAASRDTIFRIASMSKPVTAVGALVLVEECVLRLDDPVDDLLPELADRRVLVDPKGPLDETVPANRPITLRDLLTFTAGLGFDFGNWGQQAVIDALTDVGLGIGPPAPDAAPAPDEFMRLLGAVPLEHQPGERWLYHLGSEILGVLLARVSGQALEAFLRQRVFEPLGMSDTAFSVPAEKLGRFGPCFEDKEVVYDAAEGQWSRPPAFQSGGGGLVSTVDDYLAFARMLASGGGDLLSPTTVDAMTTDHLRGGPGPDATGDAGWGFGVGVQRTRNGIACSAGSYGWSGGLGSSWANDPAEGVTCILLTDRLFGSPELPAVHQDFQTCTYAALLRERGPG